MCVSCGINIITKSANFSNNGAKELECGSLNGGDDGEYNGFVKISQIFAKQEDFVYEAASIDGV